MKNPPYRFFRRYRTKMTKRSNKITKLLQAMTTIMAPFENALLPGELPAYSPTLGSEGEESTALKTAQIKYAQVVKKWRKPVLKRYDCGDTERKRERGGRGESTSYDGSIMWALTLFQYLLISTKNSITHIWKGIRLQWRLTQGNNIK